MQPPPVSTAPQESNGLATSGLVCGVLSPLLCAATAIPAIILGHLSLSKIKSSGAAAKGATASVWALILGYGSLLIPIIAALAGLTAPLVLKKLEEPQLGRCESNVRLIGSALLTFNIEHGTDTAPYPSDLRQLDSMGITTNIRHLLEVSDRGPNGKRGDWLYFSAADSENPSAVLLISPLIRTKHIVLHADMSVSRISKRELQSLISAQPVPPDSIPETR
jgi:hypothetical protein